MSDWYEMKASTWNKTVLYVSYVPKRINLRSNNEKTELCLELFCNLGVMLSADSTAPDTTSWLYWSECVYLHVQMSLLVNFL